MGAALGASNSSTYDTIGDFSSLGLPPSFAPAALRAFRALGGTATEEISPAAVFHGVRADSSLLPRLYAAFDPNGSGGIDFKEVRAVAVH